MEFELNIYGANDEIVKSYATNHIKWGVLIEALNIAEDIKNNNSQEQFKIISNMLEKVFPDLTDEELSNADVEDVFNTFNQVCRKATMIAGGDSKN